MVILRRAETIWERDLAKGTGRIRFGSGAINETQVMWASRTGEPEGKTSPEELLAAAHASCYAMAFSAALAKNRTPPQRLDVTAECTLDEVNGKWQITAMDLSVIGRVLNIESSKFQEVANLAERGCPISNALRNNVKITVKAYLEE
jgi:osmotically inducible protein OsmC